YGSRHLLLLGSRTPDQNHLHTMLSFDGNNPERVVRRNPGRVWEAYYSAWDRYRANRRGGGRGRGYTPNVRTMLEGIVSSDVLPFVAIWRIMSTVGRQAAQPPER
ncbi:MAG: hypothetical protein ABIK44_02710, partial [candidate division WOR-3 bacterium]